MSIEETVEEVARCLQAGAAEKIVHLCLVDDGYSPEKAKIILRWAKMQKREVG